ncbi:MAG: ATP-binding protein [Bacteroidaceae bacterium]|nr:ATP-binding protein [Bacteroidaceae bacterium]
MDITLEQAEVFILAALKCEVAYRGKEFRPSAMLDGYISEVAKWITSEERCGILMCGKPGNGKSTMMYAIRSMLNACEMKSRFGSSIFVYTIDAKEICHYQKADYCHFKEICSQPILAIDDLGLEPAEVLDYGNVLNPVIDLLSYRYNEQLMTIVTTNLRPRQIREKYGDRIADRFNEMMAKIVFENETYRV